MALFSNKEEETNNHSEVRSMHERLINLTDVFDELNEKLDEVIKNIGYITTKVEILETKVTADLAHNKELSECKDQLKNVNLFVQNMLTTMITHKVSEPDVSPAMKAYLERKANGSSSSKLPLP